MAIWLQGLIIVGGTVLLALAGLGTVRRRVDAATLQIHHDVAGFIIAVVGVVFGVLLAVVVSAVWEDYSHAHVVVDTEANELADLFRLAQAVPDPAGRRLRELARAYAAVVVDEEWEAMGRGAASPAAMAAIDSLWHEVLALEVPEASASPRAGHLLAAMGDLADARRMRLVESRAHVPTVLWFALVGGAICTIGFTFLFGVRQARTQVVMTALLAVTISLNLFVVAVLDQPLGGEMGVGPEAFELDRAIFDASPP